MLEARGVKKRYGSLEVLKGVDIDVTKGEIVSIVGSSGAGKSTFLHILGTLDRLDEGDVYLNGIDYGRLTGNSLAAFRNKHIGFVFQFHHLLPEFTALENTIMPALINGSQRKRAEITGLELLERLGIKGKKDNRPNEMSGGEQQRVAIARALMNKPEIVFADEPTGNLDSTNANALHHLFLQLSRELNQTFLIVTHNEEMAELGDRVVHMKDGFVI